ncbi:MAG: Fur family transcriptional regulator [Cyanobacteria bacterium P01_A01_bin.135]
MPQDPPRHIRSLDDALAHCQALGMRLSKQRRYILELLWSQPEHLSAREIYNRLIQQGKDIGHTSVYQNLEALSSQAVIECVERADGRLYGSVSASHSHVNCLDTSQILDVFVTLPEHIVQDIEQRFGVTITDYRIDFFGYTGSNTGSSNGNLAPQDERHA